MKTTLSPRDLANAIDFSESSVKRWADAGDIRVSRTAGGHRRIPRSEAIEFIRQKGIQVVRPTILGFPEAEHATTSPDHHRSDGDALFQAFRDGCTDHVLGLIQGWFLSGRTLGWIFDGPIAEAMTRIGDLWRHQGDGILIEHRATDLCIQAVTQLRLAIPRQGPNAPVAIGASPTADPYLMPSIMAATILQGAGMQPINLGPETPLDVLHAAAEKHHACMAWFSVSTDAGAEDASAGMGRLADALGGQGTHLVVGGRTAGQLKATCGPNVILIDSMAELAAFAKGLMANTPPTGAE